MCSSRQRFLHAVRGLPTDRPPVWFMRQAGRHLPEYRALRQQADFIQLCREPRLCAAVTCQPWQRYGLDAVIIFNDILTPLADAGIKLHFDPGPRFERLIAHADDLHALARPDYLRTPPDVARCLEATRASVGADVAMLGFVGAPFTVAAYAVAGAGAARTTRLAGLDPPALHTLAQTADWLLESLADYAAAQHLAGADAIQIFESAAADAPSEAYAALGLPRLERLIAAVHQRCPAVPIIVFGLGLADHYERLASQPGVACLSVDHHQSLADVRARLNNAGFGGAVQGNLDPAVLEQEPAVARQAAELLLQQWACLRPLQPALADTSAAAAAAVPESGPAGWVFNLGHGVGAAARPESALAVVEAVKRFEPVDGGAI